MLQNPRELLHMQSWLLMRFIASMVYDRPLSLSLGALENKAQCCYATVMAGIKQRVYIRASGWSRSGEHGVSFVVKSIWRLGKLNRVFYVVCKASMDWPPWTASKPFLFWPRWNVSGPLIKLGTPSKLQKVELVGTDSSSKKVRLGKMERGGGKVRKEPDNTNVVHRQIIGVSAHVTFFPDDFLEACSSRRIPFGSGWGIRRLNKREAASQKWLCAPASKLRFTTT